MDKTAHRRKNRNKMTTAIIQINSTNVDSELKEWNSIVDNVSYLDWKIGIQPYGNPVFGIRVIAYAKTTDSDPPHKPTVINHAFSFSGYPTGEDWKIRTIFRILCSIQVHEASEFFKYKNRAVFHAHNEADKYREFEYNYMAR